MEILVKAGKTVVEFSGIKSNPTYDKVQEGARLARENHVGGILAIGGGSVMDCCKAVSLAAVYKGDIWTDFWAKADSTLTLSAFSSLFQPYGVIG